MVSRKQITFSSISNPSVSCRVHAVRGDQWSSSEREELRDLIPWCGVLQLFLS